MDTALDAFTSLLTVVGGITVGAAIGLGVLYATGRFSVAVTKTEDFEL